MDFAQLNETDVREEIVAPLIRSLGYRSASEHNVLREQTLRYPRSSLGHKKPNSDPLLRGKADYILEAARKVRWIIEAKAPSCEFDVNEIEQAWTYANHPEVRAVYFALCNGLRFVVYRTTLGPLAEPLISLTYEQLENPESRQVLFGLLAPQAILRDHASYTVDVRPPLGTGLRSIARISHGYIRYNQMNPSIPALQEMQVTIVGGSVERDDQNRMIALVETRAPMRTIQALVERLNLQVIDFQSEDEFFSEDQNCPTQFIHVGETTFPKDAILIDPQTWQPSILQRDLLAQVQSVVRGTLSGNTFSGVIENLVIYEKSAKVTFAGEFALSLS